MPELIEKLMKDGYTEEAEILKKYYRCPFSLIS